MRFVRFMDKEEREKLKPVAGDLLDFGGVYYIAEQVGLKYVVAHLASDPGARAWLKIEQVCKVVPDAPPPALEEPFDREQDSLLGWRFSDQTNTLVRSNGR